MYDFHPPLTFRPPQRPTWMPSALLPSHNTEIPPHAIHTLIGRANNRPSLRAMPTCGTSLLACRQPYQTTFCRVSLRTSAPPCMFVWLTFTRCMFVWLPLFAMCSMNINNSCAAVQLQQCTEGQHRSTSCGQVVGAHKTLQQTDLQQQRTTYASYYDTH